MNAFAKFLLLILFTVLPSLPVFSQSETARGSYNKPMRTFELTLKNTKRTTATVIAVGIKSEVVSGSFMCMAGDARAGVLNLLANYLVPFHVATPETLKDAEPQIELPPGQQARVAISVSPSAVGACGPWSIKVSPIVQFQNGARNVGEPVLITSADYAESYATELADSELLKALKHLDPAIRTAAIKRLAESKLTSENVIRILQGKLDDKNAEVRIAAAATAARLKHKSLAPKIAVLLTKAAESKEASAYCWALSRLRDPATIDALIETFANLNLEKPFLPYSPAEYNFSAKEALIKFEHPDVPVKLRPLLTRQAAWKATAATEKQVARFSDLCVILTTYRDVESAAGLNRTLTETTHEILLGNVMRELIAEDSINQGPFVIALKPALQAALNHQNWNHRFAALRLLLSTQPDSTETERLLRQGLRDTHAHVSAAAAELTTQLQVKTLIPELRELATKGNNNEKKPFCDALTALGAACP